MLDFIIRNGTVIDGTGGNRFPADVGIVGGRITAVEIWPMLNVAGKFTPTD